MLKELKPAFLMMVVMTVLTGFIYPAVITGDRAGRCFAIRRTAA